MNTDESRLFKVVEDFGDVFDKKELPTMNTEPMEIKPKQNYVPKAVTVARRVAFPRREEELKEIRKLESEGIIEPIQD